MKTARWVTTASFGIRASPGRGSAPAQADRISASKGSTHQIRSRPAMFSPPCDHVPHAPAFGKMSARPEADLRRRRCMGAMVSARGQGARPARFPCEKLHGGDSPARALHLAAYDIA